jgi:hypothetical protein
MLGNPRLKPSNNQAPAETRFKAWWHLVGSAIENGAKQHMKWRETAIEDLERVFPADRNEQWLKRRAEWNEACEPEAISFSNMFAAGESGEEQSSSIHDVMKALRERYSHAAFGGSDVAAWINTYTDGSVAFRVALEAATGGKPLKEVTARTVTWKLKTVCGAPVVLEDNTTIALKFTSHNEGGSFVVQRLR